MNAPRGQVSIWNALRRSAAAGFRASRQMTGAALAAAATVAAAIREDRGVVRTACMATEQSARLSMRTVREFAEESVAAWRPVPFLGAMARYVFAAVASIGVAILSVVVSSMIACDVLLNTARTERIG